MIDPCSDPQWHDIVRNLRAVCPPPSRTSLEVRRVADLDGPGYASKKGRKFLIEIRAGMGTTLTEWALLHEWAHVCNWRPQHPLSSDHDATFWVWHGIIYCKYYGVD